MSLWFSSVCQSLKQSGNGKPRACLNCLESLMYIGLDRNGVSFFFSFCLPFDQLSTHPNTPKVIHRLSTIHLKLEFI